MRENSKHLDSRRSFLRGTALGCGALLLGREGSPICHAGEIEAEPVLQIGLLSDLHYADKATAGNRHYRDSLRKLRPAVDHFNKVKADFAVELGDFVDEAPSLKEELSYLEKVEAEFARFKGDRHYVLGNHCVARLKKEEFLSNCGQRRKAKRAYYSFDRGGFHFVVLDACFRADGVPYGRKNFKWTDTEIPPEEFDMVTEQQSVIMLLGLVSQGMLVATDEGYHSELLFENGELTVNGTPIPLPVPVF